MENICQIISMYVSLNVYLMNVCCRINKQVSAQILIGARKPQIYILMINISLKAGCTSALLYYIFQCNLSCVHSCGLAVSAFKIF